MTEINYNYFWEWDAEHKKYRTCACERSEPKGFSTQINIEDKKDGKYIVWGWFKNRHGRTGKCILGYFTKPIFEDEILFHVEQTALIWRENGEDTPQDCLDYLLYYAPLDRSLMLISYFRERLNKSEGGVR